MAHLVELPDTVRLALGPEAARDFLAWLDERLPHSVAAEVPISALVACQRVNVLMLETVSNLLLAGEPVLTETTPGKLAWRVPVDLTYPGRGRVGRVAEIEVDAQYGEVRYTDALLEEIRVATQSLADTVLHEQT